MKLLNLKIQVLVLAFCGLSLCAHASCYVPTDENLQSRQEFENLRFGIFLHWGIYASFAQGEWYMQSVPMLRDEYAKAAAGFYPIRFNAHDWVAAIKASGAGYICITSRHHDGFSMWGTHQSPYNIVDATPFGRDVLKELADECAKQGIRLHFYYSLLDWRRDDYPMGRTGRKLDKDPEKSNWSSYFSFMNAQLTELLTSYGPVGAIWLDGWWDHDSDVTPFDWHFDELYSHIHRLQPSCLVANNHHITPFEGEDIQIFERDQPGQNTAGFVESAAEVSRLPLETCQTMNGMWGYKVADQNYKSTEELIHYLVNTAGRGANLLLNIGPQASGELPATAIERLKEMGEWMKTHGETIRGTRAGDIAPQTWGATTRKGNRLFVHILNYDQRELFLPLSGKVRSAFTYDGHEKVGIQKTKTGVVLTLPQVPSGTDYIIELYNE